MWFRSFDFCHFYLTYLYFTFSEAKIFICQFHYGQAWKRWVTKSDNDATIQKEELLNRLRQIANTTAQNLYKEAVRSHKCQFHLGQAWKRCVTKSANNVAIRKEELPNRLRQIANTTAQDLYKEAVRSHKCQFHFGQAWKR